MGTADGSGLEPDHEVTGLRDASVGGNGLQPAFRGASWAEFFSVVTHPRIYDPPSRVDQAIDQIDAWLETAAAVMLGEGETYWPRLRALWTAGRDFSRFPRLRTVNPLL